MQTRKLEIACPVCKSTEVVYSCTPMCCFNHVCGGCKTTFEPVTAATGEKLPGVAPPDPPPDGSDPTVACDNCESTAVYMAETGSLICTDCGALLELELTEIAPG